MFNLDKFIADSVTFRPQSMFEVDIKANADFTKAQVVEAIKEFIPSFEHEEKGKNLD